MSCAEGVKHELKWDPCETHGIMILEGNPWYMDKRYGCNPRNK